ALVRIRTAGLARLLCIRCERTGQVAPRDAAGAGSPPGRGLSGPIHVGRGPDGVGRGPDRYGDPLPAPGRLGVDSRSAHTVGRFPFWRVRRPDVRGRTMGRVVGPVGNPVAKVRVRGVDAG